MTRKTPADGDVVIHAIVSGSSRSFALGTASGPDQFTCQTRAEATRVARAYAAHARVSVWTGEAGTPPTMLVCFRVSVPGTRNASSVLLKRSQRGPIGALGG